MNDIVGFLLARIAEDEAMASRAGSFTPWAEVFQVDDYGCLRIQPDRILRECEAKRRIVDLHTVAHCCATDDLQRPTDPLQFEGGGRLPACPTIRAMAAAYADHPDYRDEWHDTPGQDS